MQSACVLARAPGRPPLPGLNYLPLFAVRFRERAMIVAGRQRGAPDSEVATARSRGLF